MALVVDCISLTEQNTKPEACTQKDKTFVAHFLPLSVCCLATVCCLDPVQPPQSMVALVVVRDDTLSSNLVLNQASYMKVAEDRA